VLPARVSMPSFGENRESKLGKMNRR
jgi:hypothetical protein